MTSPQFVVMPNNSSPSKLSRTALLIKHSLLTLSLLTLVSCSLFDDERSKENAVPTLADLPQFDHAALGQQPEVTPSALHSLYQQILSMQPDGEMTQKIRYRLSQMNTEAVSSQELAVPEEQAALRELVSQYEQLLQDYPTDLNNELIRYQLARSYDLLGGQDKTLEQLNRLISDYPDSDFSGEVWFRKADIHYSRAQYEQALAAYQQVLAKKVPQLHQHANYMAGWSLFKMAEYAKADAMFLQALDLIDPNAVATTASADPQQQRLRDELTQILSVSLSYQQQSASLLTLLEQTPYRQGAASQRPLALQASLYQALADFLAQKKLEAASLDTYRTFIKAWPRETQAADFQLVLIARLLSTAQAEQALAEQRFFIDHFGPVSEYWQNGRPAQKALVSAPLLEYLNYFARQHYSEGLRSQAPMRSQAFAKAVLDFQAMLTVLADPATTTQGYASLDIQYLLAEALAESGQRDAALAAYEPLAYPTSNATSSLFKPEEAAYRALLLQAKVPAEPGAAVQQTALWQAQSRFVKEHPQHPFAMQVALQQLQQLYDAKDYPGGLQQARLMIEWPLPVAGKDQQEWQQQAWFIQSQIQLAQEDYGNAEQSLTRLLSMPLVASIDKGSLKNQLASSIYQQAQQPAQDKKAQQQHLQRLLAQPNSAYHEAAAYQQLELMEGAEAELMMGQFLAKYPKSERRQAVQAKLIAGYEKSGNFHAAAAMLESLAQETTDPNARREARWSAAQLYQRSGQNGAAIKAYQAYLKAFSQPHDVAQEARYQLLLLQPGPASFKARSQLQDEIVKAERSAFSAVQTDRSKFITAQALLALGNAQSDAFKVVRLSHPLKKSLNAKRQRMKQAIAYYEQSMAYGIAPILSQAQYQIAELYRILAKDLLASERPQGLDELSLEQYNLLLEEQAYPFEEQAIGIYQKNTSLVKQDIYDEYVRQSYARLAELMPARYQKLESYQEAATDATQP